MFDTPSVAVYNDIMSRWKRFALLAAVLLSSTSAFSQGAGFATELVRRSALVTEGVFGFAFGDLRNFAELEGGLKLGVETEMISFRRERLALGTGAFFLAEGFLNRRPEIDTFYSLGAEASIWGRCTFPRDYSLITALEAGLLSTRLSVQSIDGERMDSWYNALLAAVSVRVRHPVAEAGRGLFSWQAGGSLKLLREESAASASFDFCAGIVFQPLFSKEPHGTPTFLSR